MCAQEAAQCGVHSVLMLPIFGDAAREVPIGVLEMVQSSRSASASSVVHALASSIKVRRRGAPLRTPPMKDARVLPNRDAERLACSADA